MDPVHDRGSMDPVHESGPWTQSKVGVHGPLVHVLSSPLIQYWGIRLAWLDCVKISHIASCLRLKILHNHYLQFFLGIAVVPGETKDNV